MAGGRACGAGDTRVATGKVVPLALNLPQDFDWRSWIERYDRMQQRYLVRREQRFDVIIDMVRATQPDVRHIVDLGCGTGSLTERLVVAFPNCQIVGVEMDWAILLLAKARLARFGDRARLVRADFRQDSWRDHLVGPAEGVVSATALHWLSPGELARLYAQIAAVLKPGGIFLSADHVATTIPAIQRAWERHRELMRHEEGPSDADTWDGFLAEYAEALDLDQSKLGEKAIGPSNRVEEGLPLGWHFDRLRENGFTHVECLWRCDCDAVYGAVRGEEA